MSYKNLDPRYITTKFKSTCNTCEKSLPKGTTAIYFPATRKVCCVPCGEPDFRAFQESVEDERFLMSLY
jgi:hypothetical protein